MRRAFLALIFLAICTLMAAQEALNNDAVIKLVKAGLSDDLIVDTINASPGKYDTSADGLIALRSAGADSKVISAVLMKSAGGAPAPAAAVPAAATAAPKAPSLPPGITEVGVYWKDRSGAWKQVLPEIVDFRSGGIIKNIATADVVKKDINGRIEGAHSRINASFPVELAVYVPEGTEITDYQLLRLHVKGEARVFRSVTGRVRVLHSSDSAPPDSIEFQIGKLAPRVYEITLQAGLGRGEYGLLPPGDYGSENAGSSGRIYAVSVLG